MDCYERILTLLKNHAISYTLHKHDPVRTVAEVEAKLPFLLDKMLKTIAFRLKDGRTVLAGLRGHDRIDYRKLAAALGVNRRAVASMSPQAIEAELGFEVGGVSPFALQPNVVVLLDENLVTLDTVYCGSGKNRITLAIKFNDLLRASGGQLVALTK